MDLLVVLSASFDKEGDAMPTQGTLTLHIRDKAVGLSSRKSHDVDALCPTEFDGPRTSKLAPPGRSAS